jgi:hypothetical protein
VETTRHSFGECKKCTDSQIAYELYRRCYDDWYNHFIDTVGDPFDYIMIFKNKKEFIKQFKIEMK